MVCYDYNLGGMLERVYGLVRHETIGPDDGNTISSVTDRVSPPVAHSFQWDSCGNLRQWESSPQHGARWQRMHTWTEDNRLQTVTDFLNEVIFRKSTN